MLLCYNQVDTVLASDILFSNLETLSLYIQLSSIRHCVVERVHKIRGKFPGGGLEMSLEANCPQNYGGDLLNKAHLFTIRPWTMLSQELAFQQERKTVGAQPQLAPAAYPALQPHLGLPPIPCLCFSCPWVLPDRHSTPLSPSQNLHTATMLHPAPTRCLLRSLSITYCWVISPGEAYATSSSPCSPSP